jgi:hypothetical protein
LLDATEQFVDSLLVANDLDLFGVAEQVGLQPVYVRRASEVVIDYQDYHWNGVFDVVFCRALKLSEVL